MATHQHVHQPQYVHYSPPTTGAATSSSSNASQQATTATTTTKTTPQAVLNGAVTAGNVASAAQNSTPTTVAPQDTTHHHYQYHIVHPHQQQHVVQPLQYHHTVPAPQPTSVTPVPGGVHATASTSTSTTPAPAAGSSSVGNGPLVATGDWTKDLIHLAKTAELKRHALTLQLHTAHILSAHASLEQKSKTIQDVKEQKNKLESERNRLLLCLRQVNEDRDKADLSEASIEKECADLRAKITELSDGEYAIAKRDVDRLRAELGQAPLPTLQSMLDEKKAQYLKERRLNGNNASSPAPQPQASTSTPTPTFLHTTAIPTSSIKRSAPEDSTGSASGSAAPVGKRPRGRPKGSKNRKSDSTAGATSSGGSVVGGGQIQSSGSM